MAPIVGAMSVTASQYATAFELQIAPAARGWGTFYAPNSGALLVGEVVSETHPTVAMPPPAQLGLPVYDA